MRCRPIGLECSHPGGSIVEEVDLKLSARLYASALALAALALTAGGASAATTINNSKSNDLRTGVATDATTPGTVLDADKLCARKGGKVVTAADGTKTCDMTGTATYGPVKGSNQPECPPECLKSNNGVSGAAAIEGPPGSRNDPYGHGTHPAAIFTPNDGCTKDQAMSDEASKGSVSSYRMAQGSTAPTANPCDARARQTSKSH